MFIREEMKEHPEISVEEETIQKDLWDIEKQIKNIGSPGRGKIYRL